MDDRDLAGKVQIRVDVSPQDGRPYLDCLEHRSDARARGLHAEGGRTLDLSRSGGRRPRRFSYPFAF